MRLTIEPTDRVVTLVSHGGAEIQARQWEGTDEHGVPVFLFVSRVAVHNDQPPEVHDRFSAELTACAAARPATGPWGHRFFID